MSDLSLAVCPHDTVHNAEGWYRLVQILTHHLGQPVSFTPALDFEDFHSQMCSADLVYANPSDALKLIDECGFVVLARPLNTYDEALLVASLELPAPTLEHVRGADLAVVEGLVPTKLALRLLRSRAVEPAALIGRESWSGVVSSLWRDEIPYGVLYRDAYNELSAQGKAMVQVITATDERVAFHMLCVGPKLAARQGALITALLAMAGDGEGRQVLADMHLAGWVAVSPDELSRMRTVLA